MKPRGLFDRIIEKLKMKQTEEIENILNEQIQAEDIEDMKNILNQQILAEDIENILHERKKLDLNLYYLMNKIEKPRFFRKELILYYALCGIFFVYSSCWA